MILNGSEILVNVLLEQGVDTVFGYPGGAVLNIYDPFNIIFTSLLRSPSKNLIFLLLFKKQKDLYLSIQRDKGHRHSAVPLLLLKSATLPSPISEAVCDNGDTPSASTQPYGLQAEARGGDSQAHVTDFHQPSAFCKRQTPLLIPFIAFMMWLFYHEKYPLSREFRKYFFNIYFLIYSAQFFKGNL